MSDDLWSQPKTEDSAWAGWATYGDMGSVMELGAMYDDALKKTEFCYFAVRVANAICEELGIKCLCTWGKWGARIEPRLNPNLDIEATAKLIINHPAWKALKLSTKICTFGKQNEEVSEWQYEQSKKADKGALNA